MCSGNNPHRTHKKIKRDRKYGFGLRATFTSLLRVCFGSFLAASRASEVYTNSINIGAQRMYIDWASLGVRVWQSRRQRLNGGSLNRGAHKSTRRAQMKKPLLMGQARVIRDFRRA
ncbi:hypothetical protein BDZ89DRAFT_1068542 [Hymenopellis radicata]|nr:hypothetical protein BDZ89DRAFT_1068542 [Hymenopellis radicata]